MLIVVSLFANWKKSGNCKADNKNVNFPIQFWLESISEKFGKVESEKVSFKGNIYGFSIDYDAIDKSEVLNIHKYLMV